MEYVVWSVGFGFLLAAWYFLRTGLEREKRFEERRRKFLQDRIGMQKTEYYIRTWEPAYEEMMELVRLGEAAKKKTDEQAVKDMADIIAALAVAHQGLQGGASASSLAPPLSEAYVAARKKHPLPD